MSTDVITKELRAIEILDLDFWTKEQAEELHLLLSDIKVRDSLFIQNRTTENWICNLLACCTVYDLKSAPIYIFVAEAMWAENPSIALRLTELALKCDPQYGLAQLFRTALTAGMPYSHWRQLMDSIDLQKARGLK